MYPCSELAQKYEEADPHQIPTEILNIKGQKHISQIHFSSSTRKGSGDFAVDDILDKPKKPTLSQGTSTSEKKPPGTPPHDVLDTVAQTFVIAMTRHKTKTSGSQPTAKKQATTKRQLLPQSSSASKKKTED